jgi:hypothetical protein
MVATMGAVSQHKNPAIHNALWPGVVGKGPGSEPFIDLVSRCTKRFNSNKGT